MLKNTNKRESSKKKCGDERKREKEREFLKEKKGSKQNWAIYSRETLGLRQMSHRHEEVD